MTAHRNLHLPLEGRSKREALRVRGSDVEQALQTAASRLREAGIESPRKEARLLLADVLKVPQETIVAGTIQDIPSDAIAAFEALVARRAAREPLAYILGRREFVSLDFEVAPGILIPRPESETLIEEALRRFPDRDASLKVLDLGTGSGCLLLAFLSQRPNARGMGIDISPAALAIAESNAKALGLEPRAEFMPSDWTENVSGAFDVVFINPPYIAESELPALEPEVSHYEPRTALCGGMDGLAAYRRIAAGLKAVLLPGGLAFFELGRGQAEPVAALLTEKGLTIKGTICDLAGIPRCLVVGSDLG